MENVTENSFHGYPQSNISTVEVVVGSVLINLVSNHDSFSDDRYPPDNTTDTFVELTRLMRSGLLLIYLVCLTPRFFQTYVVCFS